MVKNGSTLLNYSTRSKTKVKQEVINISQNIRLLVPM